MNNSYLVLEIVCIKIYYLVGTLINVASPIANQMVLQLKLLQSQYYF